MITENFKKIENSLYDLCSEYSIPGCVIGFANNDFLRFCFTNGYSSVKPKTEELTFDTIFDLASLTKPLITASLVIKFLIDGKLDLNSSISDYIDDVPGDKQRITIKELMTHTSGIRAWYPCYAKGNDLDTYVNTILNLELHSEVRMEYSCLNYILLSQILTNFSKRDFVNLAQENLIEPLGLQNTFIGSVPKKFLEHTAATEENCRTEREMVTELGLEYDFPTGILRGVPHDTNTRTLNGNSGNSGLLSNAAEIIKLLSYCVNDLADSNQNISDLIFKNQISGFDERRTIAWELASETNSAGTSLPETAIGHTGFTGTSVWYLPETDQSITILSNRLHPEACTFKMNEFRRNAHNILSALIN